MSAAVQPPSAPWLHLFLAGRGLSQSRVTLALLVLAVACGVGLQVPNAANMEGYEAELLRDGVSAGFSDVRVRPLQGAEMERAAALCAWLRKQPEVRAALPVLVLPGALRVGDGPLEGVPVIGVPQGEPYHPFRLLSGSVVATGDRSGLLLGSAVAARLGVGLGDTVQLRVVLPVHGDLLEQGELGRYAMTVRGITGGTFGAYESAFVDYRLLGAEAGTPDAAAMVLVYAGDHFAAHRLAGRLGPGLLGFRARARSWMEDSAYLASAISATRKVRAVSEVMVVLAVSIPVLALLYISVLNRRRQVGILGALGFAPGEIFIIFLLQALLIGLAGATLGCGIGHGLVRYFQWRPIFEWEGFVIRPLPSWRCYLQPVLVVLGATLASGVYPAWRAARLDPASVLRDCGE